MVYRAEDTKLNRLVELKFLAQHLLDDTPPTIRIVQAWHEEFRDREQ